MLCERFPIFFPSNIKPNCIDIRGPSIGGAKKPKFIIGDPPAPSDLIKDICFYIYIFDKRYNGIKILWKILLKRILAQKH